MCLITNIQRYSIHDGDGIRTTVFFKGCPLRCAWCHNPETQEKKRELLYDQGKCTGCGACMAVCPQKAVAIENGRALTDRRRCNACGGVYRSLHAEPEGDCGKDLYGERTDKRVDERSDLL